VASSAFNPLNKTLTPITSNGNILAVKHKTQPITDAERHTLNTIYNESVIRMERTLQLLEKLDICLSSRSIDEQYKVKNIKQMLIDEEVDPDVLHALKMVKRHFYINITNNTIANVIQGVRILHDNLLKTCKGLMGQMDVRLQVLPHNPSAAEISKLYDKTYVLVPDNSGGWELSYYEDRVKKKTIPINDVDAQINNIPSVELATVNASLIIRKIMLYHAKNMQSKNDNVYISNISVKKQNDVNNLAIGYVHYVRKGVAWENYGPIYLDYRLLQNKPFLALITLMHEASHRYGWVQDRGYYHQEKLLKNGKGSRPYPEDLGKSPPKALNNADSYAYFVADVTGMNGLYDKQNSPAWLDPKKIQPLPAQKSPGSALKKFSLFALGAVAVGGICYLVSRRGFSNS